MNDYQHRGEVSSVFSSNANASEVEESVVLVLHGQHYMQGWIYNCGGP